MPWKIAYLMSRFPKISETFILYEILELQRLGLHVEIFPLIRQFESTRHAEADALVERAHYARPLSAAVLSSQWYWLRRKRSAYLKSWWKALTGNIRSPKFFLRAAVVVPLAAHFARKIEELGIQHVHAHWATHPALAAYVIKLLTGIPYSITAHAHDIYVERPMLQEKIREAKFVVTISEYNREYLADLYGEIAEDKTVVIRCGVDPSHFIPAKQRRQAVQFNILCIGSLEERKGQAYLIEACVQMKKFDIPFRCTLVGDGEQRDALEAQVLNSGLTEAVQIAGWQPRDRVKALLAEADVVVLPSTRTSKGKTEGIPVSLMEACAMQVPVVSTGLSGIPELIEHGKTGLIVADRNADALAKTLIRLYENPYLSERLAKAGREKVLREFNLRHNVLQLFNLLTGRMSAREVELTLADVSELEESELQNQGAAR